MAVSTEHAQCTTQTQHLFSCNKFQTKMCDMTVFPTEIMFRIFQMLGNEDLRKAMLVCRRWRDLGEDPSLWTWAKIIVKRDYDVQMLGIKRLNHAKKIQIYGTWDSQELEKVFQALEKLHNLSYLSIPNTNLSSLEPELLVTVVNKVEELVMFNCQITSKQTTAMCEGFCDSTKLKTLWIGRNNLSAVNKDTLAIGINNLKAVYMSSTGLTGPQVTCLLSQASKQTKLNTLWLSRGSAQQVDQQVVQQASHNIGNFNF